MRRTFWRWALALCLPAAGCKWVGEQAGGRGDWSGSANDWAGYTKSEREARIPGSSVRDGAAGWEGLGPQSRK